MAYTNDAYMGETRDTGTKYFDFKAHPTENIQHDSVLVTGKPTFQFSSYAELKKALVHTVLKDATKAVSHIKRSLPISAEDAQDGTGTTGTITCTTPKGVLGLGIGDSPAIAFFYSKSRQEVVNFKILNQLDCNPYRNNEISEQVDTETFDEIAQEFEKSSGQDPHLFSQKIPDDPDLTMIVVTASDAILENIPNAPTNLDEDEAETFMHTEFKKRINDHFVQDIEIALQMGYTAEMLSNALTIKARDAAARSGQDNTSVAVSILDPQTPPTEILAQGVFDGFGDYGYILSSAVELAAKKHFSPLKKATPSDTLELVARQSWNENEGIRYIRLSPDIFENIQGPLLSALHEHKIVYEIDNREGTDIPEFIVVRDRESLTRLEETIRAYKDNRLTAAPANTPKTEPEPKPKIYYHKAELLTQHSIGDTTIEGYYDGYLNNREQPDGSGTLSFHDDRLGDVTISCEWRRGQPYGQVLVAFASGYVTFETTARGQINEDTVYGEYTYDDGYNKSRYCGKSAFVRGNILNPEPHGLGILSVGENNTIEGHFRRGNIQGYATRKKPTGVVSMRHYSRDGGVEGVLVDMDPSGQKVTKVANAHQDGDNIYEKTTHVKKSTAWVWGTFAAAACSAIAYGFGTGFIKINLPEESPPLDTKVGHRYEQSHSPLSREFQITNDGDQPVIIVNRQTNGPAAPTIAA